MSVSVHEAFCLDSAQDRYWFFDHFLGDQLQDEWDLTIGGTGAGAVVDQQTGGIYRLRVPAANDTVKLDWNDIRSLHINKKITIEGREKLSSFTNTSRFILGLVFDASNRVMFYHDPNSTTLRMQSKNGGATTDVSSGVTLDTDYHIYRIECFPTDEIHFYYDGGEVTNSPITTNIPDDAADYLQPFSTITANGSLVVETQSDIDYIACRQDR